MKAYNYREITENSEEEKKKYKLEEGRCCCKKENRCFNFLVIGQSGSGKTTWIDAFLNHILGIEFYDKFRYRLVDETSVHVGDQVGQTKSKTK